MDIDLDFPTKFDPTKVFDKIVPASMVKDGALVKHPCGHYLQAIPVDPHTNLAAIPYEEAEALGYFKIDFLHLSVLDHFQHKKQIRALVAEEPDWTLLLNKEHVSKLFQIHKRHDLLMKIKPTSVQELADVLALMRPSKKHLVDQYLANRKAVRETLLYTKDDTGYAFKKSHALAYSLTIVLQLHLIKGGFL